MSRHSLIEKSLLEIQSMFELLKADDVLKSSLDQAINEVTKCLKNGNKLMFAGNGGSAADAQHMSAEFVSRFMFDRPGLPSIALTTDTSAITAIGNDYGFEKLFERQIQALGVEGDVLIAYSTSGTSPNVIAGLKQAKKQGVITIGLTGTKETSKVMTDLCDIPLKVPSQSTPRIQEGHLILGHILCCAVEDNIFGHRDPAN